MRAWQNASSDMPRRATSRPERPCRTTTTWPWISSSGKSGGDSAALRRQRRLKREGDAGGVRQVANGGRRFAGRDSDPGGAADGASTGGLIPANAPSPDRPRSAPRRSIIAASDRRLGHRFLWKSKPVSRRSRPRRAADRLEIDDGVWAATATTAGSLPRPTRAKKVDNALRLASVVAAFSVWPVQVRDRKRRVGVARSALPAPARPGAPDACGPPRLSPGPAALLVAADGPLRPVAGSDEQCHGGLSSCGRPGLVERARVELLHARLYSSRCFGRLARRGIAASAGGARGDSAVDNRPFAGHVLCGSSDCCRQATSMPTNAISPSSACSFLRRRSSAQPALRFSDVETILFPAFLPRSGTLTMADAGSGNINQSVVARRALRVLRRAPQCSTTPASRSVREWRSNQTSGSCSLSASCCWWTDDAERCGVFVSGAIASLAVAAAASTSGFGAPAVWPTS